MGIRKFAMFGGIAMIVVGVLAMIPALSQDAAVMLNLNTSYGIFLGLFAMNIVNKLALIGFGVAGVMASRASNVEPSVKYSRIVAISAALLAVLGLIPQTNTLFGYWPLYGANVIAAACVAIVGAYFGYAVPAQIRHGEVARV